MSLETAAHMKPPSIVAGGLSNDNDVAVSTTSSGAIAHGVLDAEGFVSIACDVAFNCRFGTSAVADPSAVYPIPPGVYSFVPPTGCTHFKIRATAAGASKWWRSS